MSRCRPVRKHLVGSRCGPSISSPALLPFAQLIWPLRASNTYGARLWLLANKAGAEKPRRTAWRVLPTNWLQITRHDRPVCVVVWLARSDQTPIDWSGYPVQQIRHSAHSISAQPRTLPRELLVENQCSKKKSGPCWRLFFQL